MGPTIASPSSHRIVIVPETPYLLSHTLLSIFTPNKENESACVKELEETLLCVGDWMDKTRLKMNPTKTEVIKFWSRFQLAITNFNSITRYLGAWLDSNLTFKEHVKTKSKPAISNILRLMHIRKYIDQGTCEILMFSLVLSHLDYSNGIMFGATDHVINTLQKVQNWAAKLTLKRKKFSSST